MPSNVLVGCFKCFICLMWRWIEQCRHIVIVISRQNTFFLLFCFDYHHQNEMPRISDNIHLLNRNKIGFDLLVWSYFILSLQLSHHASNLQILFKRIQPIRLNPIEIKNTIVNGFNFHSFFSLRAIDPITFTLSHTSEQKVCISISIKVILNVKQSNRIYEGRNRPDTLTNINSTVLFLLFLLFLCCCYCFFGSIISKQISHIELNIVNKSRAQHCWN